MASKRRVANHPLQVANLGLTNLKSGHLALVKSDVVRVTPDGREAIVASTPEDEP